MYVDGSSGLFWRMMVLRWSMYGSYFCNRCKFYYSINLHSGQVVLLSNYRRYSQSFRLIWCRCRSADTGGCGPTARQRRY